MPLFVESSVYSFGIYAALNALIMLVLSILVVRARVRTKTPIGDGGKHEMSRALRAHANNAEYVPMAMLLMWALASPLGGSIWMIHGIGAPLTIGRFLHAIALTRSTGPSLLRTLGMTLTWVAYIVGIGSIFYVVLFAQTVAS